MASVNARVVRRASSISVALSSVAFSRSSRPMRPSWCESVTAASGCSSSRIAAARASHSALSGEKTEEEILPEERQMIQSLIDETFEKFKKVVAEGRQSANQVNGDLGRKLVENWKESKVSFLLQLGGVILVVAGMLLGSPAPIR